MHLLRNCVTSYMDSAPAGLAVRLAGWLQQHIALATERSDRERWQWEVTLLAWVCEACGLPALLVHAPVVAEDLMAEAGFAARALRQAPFHRLADGGTGLPSRSAFPGVQRQ